MKARLHRLKLIERLIEDRPVASQEQLQEFLKEEGYSVTQATLSRDLRRLQVWRAVDENGISRYVLPKESSKPLDNEAKNDIVRGCLSLGFSGNMAVFRTPDGFAPTFAIAFERLALTQTLAVIAGHDTVLAVINENTSQEEYKKAIKEKVPGIKMKE